MKKTSLAWLFTVIGLVILLAISVFLGLSGYYFSTAFLHQKTDLIVGDKITIGVKPNETSVVSLTFDGGYLPEENIPQVVEIEGLDLNKNVYLRVKALCSSNDEKMEFDFVSSSHFEKANDGYYYFDDALKGGNRVNFASYLVFPRDKTFVGNKKYILSIVVETLSEELDIAEIWQKNV